MISPQHELAESGYRVLPCVPDGKRPLTEHGLKDATTDAAQIDAWSAKWPDCNWAIATDGLLVVDIDPLADGTANTWLRDDADRAQGLAAGVISLTPRGGRHFIFKAPDGAHYGNTAGKLAPKVDTRGSGGYVLVAPSKIGDKSYRWAENGLDCPPDELPLPPAWLLDALADRTPSAASSPVTAGNPIPKGQRNAVLASMAGSVRRIGSTEAEMLAYLKKVNRDRCQPPVEEEEVERIVKSIARKEPNQASVAYVEHWAEQDRNAGSRPIVINLADVTPQPIRWLWPKRIPLGKLTLIAGQPGQGKSSLTMDIASRVTRGSPWPDSPTELNPAGGAILVESGSVILLSAEDDIEDTIVPRLMAAGANMGRINALQGVEFADASKRRCFNLESDLPSLERTIQDSPDCRLIIIDPVSSYLGGTDSHKNAEVRGLIAPLSELANRYGVAVVMVTHFSKGQNQSAINAPTGSIAFVGAARASWIVVADKSDTERRLFLPLKNNLTKDVGGLAFRIVDKLVAGEVVGAVEWEPGTVSTTADEAISGNGGADRGKTALQIACDWLAVFLANGPKTYNDVEEAAEAELITTRTLERAKAKLGVISVKAPNDRGGWQWQWILPGWELFGKAANNQPI